MNTTWSTQLVEELLFRQYIKGEDVSSLLPPPPAFSADQYMENYDKSTKVLLSYVQNGPTAALSSQNVNTASRMQAATPVKGQPSSSRAANLPPTAADNKLQATRTPKGKETSSAAVNSPLPVAPDRSTQQENVEMPTQLKGRVEWPPSVPTNASLKSNSRSKVAHLTAKRVASQEGVDPDLIFAQNPEELPLHAIFSRYPKALESLAAVRGASGDWRNDTFTTEEETQYKRDLGFVYIGPSQCSYARTNLFQK